MELTTLDYNNSVEVPRLSDNGYLATGVYLSILATIATIGNILVLTVILRDSKLREKPHNLLIVNLAVADLGISFTGYPLTTISGFYGRWVFSKSACYASGFFSFLLAMGSMDTMACISVFRYIMICESNKKKYLTIKNTKYALMFIWIYALVWTGFPLLGWGGYALEPYGTGCSLDWTNRKYSNITYIVCTIIFCYLIHIGIMTYCYKNVIQTTRKLRIWDKQKGKLQTRDDAMWIHRVATDYQVTIMCVLIVASFVIFWTPYTVISILYIIKPDLPLELTTLPTMFCKASCMANPIIYFCTNSQFRDACKKIYCPCLYRRIENRVIPTKTREYDEITKDGIYVGRGTIHVIENKSMF